MQKENLKIFIIFILIFLLILLRCFGGGIDSNIIKKLQKTSVLVETTRGYSSGFIVKKGNDLYVISAGHAIEEINVTTNLDIEKTIDKELLITLYTYNNNDFLLNTQKSKAKVIFHSDSDVGSDILIARVEDNNFSKDSTYFYQGDSKKINVGAEIINFR